MQDEGLVGSIGVATGTYGPLRKTVETNEFDCIQFPRLYTLLNQAAKTTGLLEAAKEKDIATLSPSPFGGSILATGARPGATYCFRPALPEVMEAVTKMEARCAELGVTLPAAAMAYSLTEPLVDITIVGVVNTQELAWDLEALSVDLTRDELDSIAAAGAIDSTLLGGPEFRLPWPADRQSFEGPNEPEGPAQGRRDRSGAARCRGRRRGDPPPPSGVLDGCLELPSSPVRRRLPTHGR